MRSSARSTSIVALAVALSVAGSAAQTSRPADGQDQPLYLSRATAILVDVVVRDKQGAPVLDLKSDDFEIAEDGVPQKVGSFTLVSRGSGIGVRVRKKDPTPTTLVTPGGPSEEPAQKPEDVPIIALVFDALSSQSLSLCQRAALDSIKMSGDTPARVAVFETEPLLRVVQRYTTDPTAIRLAVSRVMASGTEVKMSRQEQIEDLRQRLKSLENAGLDPTSLGSVGGGAALAGAVGAIGQLEVERRLAQGQMHMLRAFDSLDRDHRGYSATTSMLAILETMTYLGGRKSVVFFSEGLPASPALQSQLQSLIEAANRSNITIYTVDATGLRAISATSDTRKELDAAADERRSQSGSGVDYTDGPLTKVIERAEDLMRFNEEGGLEMLADDTGGFLIRGTNDIGTAFRRIDEDMRFHYLLTYSPRKDVMDGKFRTISVKVRRPGVSVFARKGYRAVTPVPGSPVMTYEAPALALLDATPIANAFPSQASAFAFPEPRRPGLTPIVVRVTTDVLKFDVDPRKSTYSGQAAVVVRIRDANGNVMQKLSQQYVLTGDSKEVDTARKGEILFYRELELPNGVYQMESMVYDAIAEAGSGRISTITVAAPDPPRLGMSSLVVVARTEQTPGRAAPKDGENPPFYYGDTLLYPNVGEPLKRGRDDALSFYFVVYPGATRTACSAHVSILRNGSAIADVTRELPATDDSRLQQVGNLPITDLPAGTYQLRVTISNTQEQQTRTAFFTVS